MTDQQRVIKFLVTLIMPDSADLMAGAEASGELENQLRNITDEVARRMNADGWDVETVAAIDRRHGETADQNETRLARQERLTSDLMKPYSIDIDARRQHFQFSQSDRKTKYARCGNCSERMQISDDPSENHHLAMEHRLKCRRAPEAWPQQTQLIEDFEAQPETIAMRGRIQAENAARDSIELRLVGFRKIPAELFDAPPKRSSWWQRFLDWCQS